MDRMTMHTPNLADENFKKLAALFPNAVTESVNADGKVVRAIDKDVLMQEISTTVVEGREERYQFTWPDKKKAMLAANAPISATLRPVKADSVGKDGTPGGWDSENLYIEGDNLDVLKLLRETYLGKVKMIYIDPPYNTGNDFVYEDDFAEDTDSYMGRSGQYDEQGNQLVQNTDSNGRFHTDWLNMIYPRLRVAKDLLTDDGVIFISIDDNEQGNLKKVCDEILGEDNFIASLIWAAGRKNDSKYISVSHEYILCYVKSIQTLNERKIIWRERKQGIDDIYAAYDKIRKQYGSDFKASTVALKDWYKSLPDTHPARNHSHYSCIDERGIYFPADISWPGGGGPKYEVLHPITHKPVKIPNRGWVYPTKARMDEVISLGLVHFGDDENSVPCKKTYLTDGEYTTPYSVFYKDGRASTKRLRTLMGAMVFQNPKDEYIIKSLLDFTLTNENSIVLDFFSGSATTAHAVMQLNAEDGGHRKFIMVQLPEATDEKSEAYKAGYKNICEIGKERIRRAGRKIRDDLLGNGELYKNADKAHWMDSPEYKAACKSLAKQLDIGFRCLRLDSSNMQDIYYTPNATQQDLLAFTTDNIKPDRTPEDLLFQMMLELGVLPSSTIAETEIGGKKVFDVADGFLLACFDKGVTTETVTAIAKKQPYYAVFRDASMADDSTATNFDQIFETYSPSTVRKVL